MRDAEAAGEQVEGELERLGVVVALHRFEPLEARLGGALEALHLRPPAGLVRRERGGNRRAPSLSAAASAIASSIASLVPEPTEKCAVWAASPSSTTFPECQRAFRTVGNRRQMERLARRRWPWSSSSKSCSRYATVPRSSISSRPLALQVSSLASTMKVERPGAYWYACVRQSPSGEGLK